MTPARTPFNERLSQACHLASLERPETGTSSVLAASVSANLGERFSDLDVEAWREGVRMPNADQRRALAHALGLGSELSPFLVSDEEEVVGPL
ncbi:hypothetical protein BKA16_004715, partial [Gordonia humi]|nr:hypothetical protein [Gordonia humi]